MPLTLLTILFSFFIGTTLTWHSYYCISDDSSYEPSTTLLDQSKVPYTKFLWLGIDAFPTRFADKYFTDIIHEHDDVLNSQMIILDRPKPYQFSAGLWSMALAGQMLSRNEGLPRGMETFFSAFPNRTGLYVEDNEFILSDEYFGKIDKTYHYTMAEYRWFTEPKYNEILDIALDDAMIRVHDTGRSCFVYDMRWDSIGHMQKVFENTPIVDYELEQIQNAIKRIRNYAMNNTDTLVILSSDHGNYNPDKKFVQHKPGVRTTLSEIESTVHGTPDIFNAGIFILMGAKNDVEWPMDLTPSKWDLTRPLYNLDQIKNNYNNSVVPNFELTMRTIDVPLTLSLFIKGLPILRNSVGVPMGPNAKLEGLSDADAILVCKNLEERAQKVKKLRPNNPFSESDLFEDELPLCDDGASARINAIKISTIIEDTWCDRAIWGTAWVYPCLVILLFILTMSMIYFFGTNQFSLSRTGALLFAFTVPCEALFLSEVFSPNSAENLAIWRSEVAICVLLVGAIASIISKDNSGALVKTEKDEEAAEANTPAPQTSSASPAFQFVSKIWNSTNSQPIMERFDGLVWGIILIVFYMLFMKQGYIFPELSNEDKVSFGTQITISSIVLFISTAYICLADEKNHVEVRWGPRVLELYRTFVPIVETKTTTESNVEEATAVTPNSILLNVLHVLKSLISFEGLFSAYLTILTTFIMMYYAYEGDSPSLDEDVTEAMYMWMALWNTFIFGVFVVISIFFRKDLFPGMFPAMAIHWSVIASAHFNTAFYSAAIAPVAMVIAIQWVNVNLKSSETSLTSTPSFVVYFLLTVYGNNLLLNPSSFEYAFTIQPWMSKWDISWVEVDTLYKHVVADNLPVALLIALRCVFIKFKETDSHVEGTAVEKKRESIYSVNGIVFFFWSRLTGAIFLGVPAWMHPLWAYFDGSPNYMDMALTVGGPSLLLAQSSVCLMIFALICLFINLSNRVAKKMKETRKLNYDDTTVGNVSNEETIDENSSIVIPSTQL